MPRDLVERAMAGDHDAFAELVRSSTGRLFAAARLILRDDERAEDATQEAFVAAWRDLSALRDPDRFEAWLHRLLVRACYREARRERRFSLVEARVRLIEPVEPDRTADLADRDRLEAGFRHLDTDQRTLIVLCYYLGLEPVEAAEALGLPHGTVKSRLHRARQALRAALEADARQTTFAEGRNT
jgi:RNA polymerase sigma-70 factor (ECF subfamily)